MVIKKYLGEIWRPIRGYEGWYEVSNFGRVRSLDRERKTCYGNVSFVSKLKGKVLKLNIGKNGYYYIALSKDGDVTYHRVHRLVAFAFPEICGEPIPDGVVNHLDENPLNCAASNLRWCTRTENLRWGTCIKRMKEKLTNKQDRSKPVIQYTLGGEFVAEYPSGMEAQRQTGFPSCAINQCCLGNYKQSHGYIWKYKTPSV